MTQKIAIAVLHGAGRPEQDFATEMMNLITTDFAKQLNSKDADQELVFEPVFWSDVFAEEQGKLWELVQQDTNLRYSRLRQFVVEFLGDAIAYQPTSFSGQNYDRIHAALAQSIGRLKEKAGRTAPLCVICHSLGSVVAGNYFLDLQHKHEQIGMKTKQCMDDTPLEKGDTLSLFYTMGSPMALWSVRYLDFGSPICIPALSLADYYPKVQGEWLNFYDRDDVLAYPLKGINDSFHHSVTEDVEINAGGLFTSWNPLSHSQYMTEQDVIDLIVNGLVQTWKEVNE